MPRTFTSESVSEGHPDKVADQISDAILDHFLVQDPNAKVACETLVTKDFVVISGETKSTANVDIPAIAREVIRKIGYTNGTKDFDADTCSIMNLLHEQSSDIRQGVEKGTGLHKEQGAGDQGMMFGYACNETENYMPLTLDMAHLILLELARVRKETDLMPYLGPDAKSQVTVRYNGQGQAEGIENIVISTQHEEIYKGDDDRTREKIREDIEQIIFPRILNQLPERLQPVFENYGNLLVNPTGRFVEGGPGADTGLTGRKIIVDTYGGKGAHGGGAFSGKDPSKVDRSAAYAARHIAKNLVASGVADEALVQVAYAIGYPEPVGFYVNTYGSCHTGHSDEEIENILKGLFDMRPAAIIERLKLKEPIYFRTASYGHMGRQPRMAEMTFHVNGQTVQKQVELFTWEKLDMVDEIRKAFGL